MYWERQKKHSWKCGRYEVTKTDCESFYTPPSNTKTVNRMDCEATDHELTSHGKPFKNIAVLETKYGSHKLVQPAGRVGTQSKEKLCLILKNIW